MTIQTMQRLNLSNYMFQKTKNKQQAGIAGK